MGRVARNRSARPTSVEARRPVPTVIWDLDETLLPTAALLDLRHSRTPTVLRQSPGYGGIQLHPGVAEAFHRLGDRSAGLVTSSPRWYVEQILADHLPTVGFDVIVTYEDVSSIKPDPEPILIALERLQVTADQAVYVGDDLVDFEACRSAGVRFVGAGWSRNPSLPPDAERLEHPLDLLELLELG